MTSPGQRILIPAAMLFAAFAAATAHAGEEPVVYLEPGPPRPAVEAPALELTLTGTTNLTAESCGTGTSFALPPGTDVRYCYFAHNTGTVTFELHDLTDTGGPIFTDLPLALEPGFAMWLMQTRQPLASGAFQATWTSTDGAGGQAATGVDSTPITLTPPLVSCNGRTSTFSNGLPVGWTSYDWLAIAQQPDSAVDWAGLAGCGEVSNYTGARGGAACASSDLAAPQAYDTQLRTHSFSLVGVTSARFVFELNYQDFDDGAGDAITVDTSINGGATWENRAFNETLDYGAFRSAPGITVSIDLAPVIGQPNVRVGIRYVHPDAGASDWYAQVDNVRLLCDGGLFFDGFESADTHAWHVEGTGG